VVDDVLVLMEKANVMEANLVATMVMFILWTGLLKYLRLLISFVGRFKVLHQLLEALTASHDQAK